MALAWMPHMAVGAVLALVLALPAATQAQPASSPARRATDESHRRGAAAAAHGKPARGSCGKLQTGIGSSLLQVQTATSLAGGRELLKVEASGVNNLVCRGGSTADNGASYFQLHPGSPSIEACKELCLMDASCKGVEYSADLDGGRCELWTRPSGIGATAPRVGSTCLILQTSFQPMQSAGGQATGQACRGSHPEDDSPAYYDLREGISSLDECKDLCVQSGCKGVEYNQAWGRCELWKRPGGIEATASRSGFVCLKFHGAFISADVYLRGSSTTAAPTTSVKATTAPATTTGMMPVATLAPTTTTSAPPSPVWIDRVSQHFFSRTEAKHISVVNLTATTALVCSTTDRKSVCRVVDVSGPSVIFHPQFSVDDDVESVRLSVDRLSPSSVLACFMSHDAGAFRPKLVCRVLSFMGSMVAKGEATHIDVGDEVIFSMSVLGLSPAAGLICYDRVDDERLEGVCKMITVSGKQLFPGGHKEIGSGDLEFGPEIVATRFAQDRALVCYRAVTERAVCNVLTLAGIAILKGDDFNVSDGHFHSLSAVGLSPTAAMICLKDFTTKPAHSSCSLLAANGDQLSRVDKVDVFTGRTKVARISESAALACSSDGHHEFATMCTTLAIVGSSLAKGQDSAMQAIGEGEHYGFAGLSSTVALLCFEEEDMNSRKQGVCTSIQLSWLGAAAPSPAR